MIRQKRAALPRVIITVCIYTSESENIIISPLTQMQHTQEVIMPVVLQSMCLV